MIIKVIYMRYLYYKLFRIFTRIKTNDMPATNAMIFLSICHFANIFVIHIFLSLNSFVSMKFNSKTEIFSFTLPLCILVYVLNYLFLYKKRDKIFEKYKNERSINKILGNVLLILYIVGSFALVFYFGSKYASQL
jgi:Ca2+/Na+ antiporter